MEDNYLQVALVQSHLEWENTQQNLAHFTTKIEAVAKQCDLVVLPEMFTTGFTMNAKKVAETMQGETLTWMQEMAEKHNVAITGSCIITENSNFYNRLLFVDNNGKIEYYDKRHTFTLAGEDKVFTSGTFKTLIHYKGWRICPFICYDLRFPVWSRNTEGYEVLLYVANWPKQRIAAWDCLLQARAIENMSYCIGVNRVGADANQHEYIGHSAAYNVLGEPIAVIEKGKETTKIVTLSKEELVLNRKKFGFLNDKDAFTLKA